MSDILQEVDDLPLSLSDEEIGFVKDTLDKWNRISKGKMKCSVVDDSVKSVVSFKLFDSYVFHLSKEYDEDSDTNHFVVFHNNEELISYESLEECINCALQEALLKKYKSIEEEAQNKCSSVISFTTKEKYIISSFLDAIGINYVFFYDNHFEYCYLTGRNVCLRKADIVLLNQNNNEELSQYCYRLLFFPKDSNCSIDLSNVSSSIIYSDLKSCLVDAVSEWS